jgi:hypothetical protein
MLVNRVLWVFFGPTRKEIKGDWMDLHKSEGKLTRVVERKMARFARHMSCMGEKKFTAFGS